MQLIKGQKRFKILMFKTPEDTESVSMRVSLLHSAVCTAEMKWDTFPCLERRKEGEREICCIIRLCLFKIKGVLRSWRMGVKRLITSTSS